MKANYDLISDAWSDRRQELGPKDRKLFDIFIEALRHSAKVLNLGCGSGIPIAKRLSDSGFSIFGIDRSENLLKKAKRNVPNGSFFKAEIEDYEIQREYDGVVLWDALFHIPREEHRAILENIYNHLASGGTLILSSGGCAEDLPPFTDFMFGVRFFYDSFTPRKLLRLLEDIGFTVEQSALVNEPDGGRDKGRLGVVLSKP